MVSTVQAKAFKSGLYTGYASEGWSLNVKMLFMTLNQPLSLTVSIIGSNCKVNLNSSSLQVGFSQKIVKHWFYLDRK